MQSHIWQCGNLVPIRGFYGPSFFYIPIEYGDLQNNSLNSVQMWENTDKKISKYRHFLWRVNDCNLVVQQLCFELH